MTAASRSWCASMAEGSDADVVHMWRVVSVTFGDRPVTVYVCDLCSERLEVGPGQIHPAEC